MKFPAFMVPRGSPPPTPADFITAFGHPDDDPPRGAGIAGQTGMPAGTETGVVEPPAPEGAIPVHPDPAASVRSALPVFRDSTQGTIDSFTRVNAGLDPATAYRRITSLLDDPVGAAWITPDPGKVRQTTAAATNDSAYGVGPEKRDLIGYQHVISIIRAMGSIFMFTMVRLITAIPLG